MKHIQFSNETNRNKENKYVFTIRRKTLLSSSVLYGSKLFMCMNESIKSHFPEIHSKHVMAENNISLFRNSIFFACFLLNYNESGLSKWLMRFLLSLKYIISFFKVLPKDCHFNNQHKL